MEKVIQKQESQQETKKRIKEVNISVENEEE